MLEAIKPLLDSDLINEDTRREIEEAWQSKLQETREEVKTELREEFANRYEHDKQVMVEALDRMVTDAISSEIGEIVAEKKAIAEDRVKTRKKMSESAKKFDNFMVKKLAEEIQELRNDRKLQQEHIKKLESFVMQALSEEIAEFAEDKKDLVETKVRLVKEADSKFKKLRQDFITRSTGLVKNTVTENLRAELTQLKEDIHAARENDFGRKIFEAFAAEYGVSHLNESKEIKKLEKLIAAKDRKLAESARKADEASTLVESKEAELRRLNDRIVRERKLKNLLKPLNEEKAKVMRGLLENVTTDKLDAAVDKYMPAVMSGEKVRPKRQATLKESRREVTGDKSPRKTEVQDDDYDNNIVQLRALAGLK